MCMAEFRNERISPRVDLLEGSVLSHKFGCAYVSYLHRISLNRSLSKRRRLGGRVRRQECEGVFCEAEVAALRGTALDLVHHRSGLLCHLLFCALPSPQT